MIDVGGKNHKTSLADDRSSGDVAEGEAFIPGPIEIVQTYEEEHGIKRPWIRSEGKPVRT